MATDAEKKEYMEQIENREDAIISDPEKAPAVPDEDGEVTWKTKMAVLSLIFMYESYLFTLIMSVSSIPNAHTLLTR